MTGSNPLAHPMLLGGIVDADTAGIAQASNILRSGYIVAVPTETVYGLAADASNTNAVTAIYRRKGRPDFNPLIVHVLDKPSAEKLAVFNDLADKLAAAFWPGPLTLVLPLLSGAPVAPAVVAGLRTIAIRCPAHPVMQAVLAKSGLCLAAPSANRSGGISPTTADHVVSSLGENGPLILDGGPCHTGLESTIVAIRIDGWQILRPGPITAEAIERIAGSPPLADAGNGIEAPGQLGSHYAPSKPLRLNADSAQADEWHIGYGKVTGDDNLSLNGDLAEAAAQLFAALHRADLSDRPYIAVSPIPQEDIGVAINDRLARAAAK
jgi:L-threonylcarbamoyladenylate synthase